MTRYTFAKSAYDLLQLQDEITAAGLPTGTPGGSVTVVVVDFAADLTAPQQAALANVVAAHVPNPSNAVNRLHAEAKAAFQTAAETSAQRDRALALVVMDEINLLRQWVTSFKAAVAAAATLADLKTRVAQLANLPDRTAVQAKAAVVTKIDASDAA